MFKGAFCKYFWQDRLWMSWLWFKVSSYFNSSWFYFLLFPYILSKVIYCCFLREISCSMSFHIKCFHVRCTTPSNCHLCKFLVSFSLSCLAGIPPCLGWQWFSYYVNFAFFTVQFALVIPYIEVGIKYLISALCCQFFPALQS